MTDQEPDPPPTQPTHQHNDSVPPMRPAGPEPAVPGIVLPSDEDKTMALLCHLLALFTSFIGPLIIWLIKKDSSRFVDAHGRAILNFIISMFIYSMILVVLLICAGFLGAATQGVGLVLLCPIYLGLLALGIFQLVVVIMRCVEAASGRFTPYPITINFITLVDPFQDGPARG